MDISSRISTFDPQVFTDLVHTYWREHNLIPESGPIIVGFSGGPDSVFLLEALCRFPGIERHRIIAAHLNHGWRAEAAQDAAWCADFAQHRNIRFERGHADQFPVKPSGSREADGRAQRRAFFTQCAEQSGASAVLLAHHADDQIETFFIRLIRGAELSGLCAMRPISGLYRHMLLPFNKESIIAFLESEKIAYLIDATNSDPAYLRNRIRKTCATLSEQDSRFPATALRSIEQLQEADSFVMRAARKRLLALRTISDDQHMLDRTQWLCEDPYLQRRILAIFLCDAGATHTAQQGFYEEIIRFAHAVKSRTHTLSPSWRLRKKGASLVVERISSLQTESGPTGSQSTGPS